MTGLCLQIMMYPEEVILQGAMSPARVYRKHAGPVHCLAVGNVIIIIIIIIIIIDTLCNRVSIYRYTFYLSRKHSISTVDTSLTHSTVDTSLTACTCLHPLRY